MTGWLANLGLVVSSSLVALVMSDILAVLANPKFSCSSREANFYQADPTRGWVMKPRVRASLCDAGYRYEVRTNEHGFRDEDWPKKGVRQILLVGDSVAFGMPLPADQGISVKLERLGHGNLAVYNAGAVGYGPPHILATMVQLCNELKFDHILFLYFFNDIRADNMDLRAVQVVDGYLVPSVKPDGGEYNMEEIREQIRRSTAHGLTLADVLTLYHLRATLADAHVHPRQLLERVGLLGGGSNYYERYLFTARIDEYPEERLRQAASIVAQMRETASRCGAQFTVVVLPTDAEAYYGLREPATDRFLALLTAHDLHIVDVRPRTRRGQAIHIHKDGHFNDAGTTFAAEQLLEVVTDKVAPGVPTSVDRGFSSR